MKRTNGTKRNVRFMESLFKNNHWKTLDSMNIKQTLLLALLFLVSPLTFSQEATGTIEQLRICGTGVTEKGWIRTLQFKIQDKWFGTYADYHGSNLDIDDNIATSMIFMAYSQNLVVHIKATRAWAELFKKCGNSSGAAFHGDNAGDYIELVR